MKIFATILIASHVKIIVKKHIVISNVYFSMTFTYFQWLFRGKGHFSKPTSNWINFQGRILIPWLFQACMNPANRIWWLCLVPISATRFASDLRYRMAKNSIGYTRKILFMNNNIKFRNIDWRTCYSLVHLKIILDCIPQLFLDPNMCGFLHIYMLLWFQNLVVNWQNYFFYIIPLE